MRSPRQYRPNRPIAICLGLTILLIVGGTSIPAHSRQNDQELYESGKNCLSQLFGSSKKQRYRIYWERCIQPFERLRSWYPQSPRRERALFILGGLYRGLHGYSGKSEDLAKAKSAYEELLKKYPKSSLARRARSRLGVLSPTPRVTIENIRHWVYPHYTRVVLDLNRPVEYHRIRGKNPPGLKLVLSNTRLAKKAQGRLASLNTELLRWIHLKSSSKGTVEVTISMEGSIGTPKVASLSNPERLVIDLFRKQSTAPPSVTGNAPSSSEIALTSPPSLVIQTIVIDPGHGGKDPGAIGRGGMTEKEVVLDIGLRLRKLIRNRLGKTVIMTRKTDTFVSLDERTLLANSKNADLFISIHTNAHPKRSTRGVEIYLLGHSSDRRALAVAARENSVSLESVGKLNRTIRQILFDLGQDYKIDQSFEFAHSTRQSFMTTFKKRFQYKVVDLRVKQAPFYVLLNSNMPGILAEVSYISNSVEERLLRKDRYRQALAETLFVGVREYIASVESGS